MYLCNVFFFLFILPRKKITIKRVHRYYKIIVDLQNLRDRAKYRTIQMLVCAYTPILCNKNSSRVKKKKEKRAVYIKFSIDIYI